MVFHVFTSFWSLTRQSPIKFIPLTETKISPISSGLCAILLSTTTRLQSLSAMLTPTEEPGEKQNTHSPLASISVVLVAIWHTYSQLSLDKSSNEVITETGTGATTTVSSIFCFLTAGSFRSTSLEEGKLRTLTRELLFFFAGLWVSAFSSAMYFWFAFA